jgi:hypothetical protein
MYSRQAATMHAFSGQAIVPGKRDLDMLVYYSRADCMSIEVLEIHEDKPLIKAGFHAFSGMLAKA